MGHLHFFLYYLILFRQIFEGISMQGDKTNVEINLFHPYGSCRYVHLCLYFVIVFFFYLCLMCLCVCMFPGASCVVSAAVSRTRRKV